LYLSSRDFTTSSGDPLYLPVIVSLSGIEVVTRTGNTIVEEYESQASSAALI